MKRLPWLLILILALATALRGYHLTNDSLWMDELFAVWLARQPWSHFWEVMPKENHPPLYYLLLRGWIGLFGEGALALRSLSAVCGVALVPVLFYTTRPLYGTRVAHYAAALSAVLPPLVRYSQEARMYSPAALFAGIALSGALLYRQAPRREYGLVFAAGATLGLYTHYFALFLWLVLTLIISSELWLQKERAALRSWLLLCALPLVAFLPWLQVLAGQYQENAETHWVTQLPIPGIEQPLTFLGFCLGFFDQRWGFQLGSSGLSTGVILSVLATTSILVFLINKQKNGGDAPKKHAPRALPVSLSITLVLLIWALCQFKNAWQMKYLIVCVPGIVVALAATLYQGKPQAEKLLGAGVVLANALCATTQTVGTMLPYNQEDWRRAAQSLRPQLNTNTVLLVPDPMVRTCLTYYGIPEDRVITLGSKTMEYRLCGGTTPDQASQALRRAHTIIAITRLGNRGETDAYLTPLGLSAPTKTDTFTGVTLERFER